MFSCYARCTERDNTHPDADAVRRFGLTMDNVFLIIVSLQATTDNMLQGRCAGNTFPEKTIVLGPCQIPQFLPRTLLQLVPRVAAVVAEAAAAAAAAAAEHDDDDEEAVAQEE